MKLSTVSIIIATALVSSVVEGFTFPGQKRISVSFLKKTKQQQQQPSNTKLHFFKSSGPAKSSDEDLELTRKVILGHIANVDGSTVAVEAPVAAVATATVEESVEEVVEMSAEEELNGDAPKKGIRKKVIRAVKKITPFKKN